MNIPLQTKATTWLNWLLYAFELKKGWQFDTEVWESMDWAHIEVIHASGRMETAIESIHNYSARTVLFITKEKQTSIIPIWKESLLVDVI